MSLEITGKIKLIRDTQQVSNSFSKREFVIETNDQYPQSIQLELHQDKCDIIDAYSVGQEVSCGINLRGREWSSPLGELNILTQLFVGEYRLQILNKVKTHSLCYQEWVL